MKNLYTLIFCLSVTFIFGQIECPTSIRLNGQASPSDPNLIIPQGENGCNQDWPETIVVDGTLTYNFVDCQGNQLNYRIEDGQTPPTTFEVTINFGNDLLCAYDENGDLVTLGLQEQEEDLLVSFSPNPVSSNELLNLYLKKPLDFNLIIYDILGNQVFHQDYKNTYTKSVNLSNLNNGIYLLVIKSNKYTSTRKLVIAN